MIARFYREVGGTITGTWIPRGTENGGGREEGPTEGMLPAATADNEYSHFFVTSLNALVNACPAFLAASNTCPTVSMASRP